MDWEGMIVRTSQVSELEEMYLNHSLTYTSG